MTKRNHMISTLAVLMTLGLLGAQPAVAQTVDVTATWNPPTEGSPVDHYILQLSTNGGPFTTIGTVEGTTYALQLTVGNTYIARVAGIDDQSRQGPWSLASDPYSPDLGPPGQPGKPMLM